MVRRPVRGRGIELRAHRVTATTALSTAAVLSLAGCAGQARHPNEPRPAAAIVVTASISRDKVSASPRHFGAGPITLIVTNQTDRSQQITLESTGHTASSRPGVRQQTGPINPRDTASLDADVSEGDYTVHVAGRAIAPASLRVRGRRPSAQNELQLP